MKLLFKQRVFSWLDSYDIYDEEGRTLFTVKGRLALGHCLEIYDARGEHLGTVQQELFTLLPRFTMNINGQYIGEIKKELTLFRPAFTLNCNGWQVQGDYFQWEYKVLDQNGRTVMEVCKELFHLSDTYMLDIKREQDTLLCLMIVLAIDAAKCSSG